MTILKRALLGAAAAGLLASQTASAAAVSNSRIGGNIGQSEELGGFAGASGPMLALFAVFLVVGVVLLVEDGDDDETPVSP